MPCAGLAWLTMRGQRDPDVDEQDQPACHPTSLLAAITIRTQQDVLHSRQRLAEPYDGCDDHQVGTSDTACRRPEY
jgi:hypothetical protein